MPPRKPRATVDTSDMPDGIGARALAGGRITLNKGSILPGSMVAMIPPPSPDKDWTTLDLSSRTFQKMSPQRLLEVLADASPDISRALWDFLRMANAGYVVRVFMLDGMTEDVRGQALTDAFISRLDDRHGSFDLIIGRLNMGAFLRGGYFAELVLDQTGRVPLDIATPDPATVRFQRVTDEVYGDGWQLGQFQGQKFVPLDRPTVRYIPVDPFPGSPYGRAIAAPALFTTLFIVGLLRDLRRVVSQQGYPRVDISIALDKLKGTLPAGADFAKFRSWAERLVSEVQHEYGLLEPDDAYVHSDVVSVNRPVGTVDSSSLGAVEGLLSALERLAVRALKTVPLLHGILGDTSEANANRQWEVHAAGIKSVQHYLEKLLERLLTLALQAQGVVSKVQVRFAELRASEMLRDAQTDQLRITNAASKEASGYLSHAEAAADALGHEMSEDALAEWAQKQSGAKPPDVVPGAPDASTTNPEPGADRERRIRALLDEAWRLITEHDPEWAREAAEKVTPAGAADDLPAVPKTVTISEADKDEVLSSWDEAMKESGEAEAADLLDAVTA